jgi:carbon starvation protein
VAVPLAFAAVVTITASFHKIFSPVPAVGYFANNQAFSKALADGKTSVRYCQNVEAMEAVVRNTAIQGWLSVIFVT